MDNDRPPCKACGAPLPEGGRRTKTYCSNRCYQIAWRDANKARLAEYKRAWSQARTEEQRQGRLTSNTRRVCEGCGVDLPADSGATKRFCTAKCRVSEARRRFRSGLTEIPKSKTCTHCKVNKSAAEFRQDSAHSDGLHSWCKQCISDSSRRAYQENREVYLSKNKAYAAANADAMKAYYRKWYEKNAASRVEQARQWRISNPERYSAVQKAVHARRRSRERSGLNSDDRKLSTAYRQAIANDLCVYCGAPGEQDDHKMPLARGGTDHWWNLTRACAPCNLAKWTMTVEEFIASRTPAPGRPTAP